MDRAFPLILFLLCGLVLSATLKFANLLGAHFPTTLVALAYSIAILAIAWIIIYSTKIITYFNGLAIASVLIWPCWWKVIDSSFLGGHDPATSAELMFYLLPGWLKFVKYGIEIGLIALAIWLFTRDD